MAYLVATPPAAMMPDSSAPFEPATSATRGATAASRVVVVLAFAALLLPGFGAGFGAESGAGFGAGFGAGALAAQQPPDDRFIPPIAGGWQPVVSIGQPPRWKPYVAVGYGVDRLPRPEDADAAAGVSGWIGVYRDLANPIYGALGVTGEAYLGQRGERADWGGRLLIGSPTLYLHAGIDRNWRLGRTDPVVNMTFPLRRGGWPTPGSHFRIDWVPIREQRVAIGFNFPLGQPLAGRTRTRQVDVELPPPPRAVYRAPPPAASPSGIALREAREALDWLISANTLFWTEDVEGRALAGGTYEGAVERYHGSLDRAFGHALAAEAGWPEAGGPETRSAEAGGPEAGGPETRRPETGGPEAGGGGSLPEAEARDAVAARGRALADRARRITLEEVVLPYNRTIGQYKQPDRLDGLIARARARFIAMLELDPVPESNGSPALLAVFDGWLGNLEAIRETLDDVTHDSRMHWLPMVTVLRPEQHRTRAQIDGLVELGLRRPFDNGNATYFFNAPQFSSELQRTIRETERYHVLWIHDYRGRGEDGLPDRTAFTVTAEGYLTALLDRVRAYDETGVLPVYIILLDQHFYEENDGRRWMTLLERPLTHRARGLRGESRWMGERIRMLQDSLRIAVAESRRLQAEAEAFGPQWIDQVVKVHVNITNPSDLSFRSRRLLMPPLGADNLMRDHRKIVIRDVTESDPAQGEVILAGVGVGDLYASPAWEDRALLLQGPGALEARGFARQTLLRHGVREADIPAPLRPGERPPDYGERVVALEESGATARLIQAHNRTGWGDKEATFIQMLLYDLAPAGTVLYVPDSVWTGYQWLAQLVNAALRGCTVFVVAPALDNAPAGGWVNLSVMQEIVTRLVVMQRELGGIMGEAGGSLHVGLYDRDTPLDDLPQLLADLEEAFAANPVLQETFPLSDEAWRVMREFGREVAGDVEAEASALSGADSADSASADSASAASSERPTRAPYLHRKTQFLVSEEVLRGMASAPEMAGIIGATLRGLREASASPVVSGVLVEQERLQPTLELLDLYHGLNFGGRDPALYFMTGSINKNVRSMALDGEALALVGGAWALQPFLDFILFSGGVTWVRDVDEVEALLPPFPRFQRRIGRWLLRVL